MAPKIWAAGEALALLRAADSMPLAQATEFRRDAAGAEYNVAIGLARLGHPVSFLGAVGDDVPGRWVRQALSAEGIDTSGLTTDATRRTGLIIRDLAREAWPAEVVYYRERSAGSQFANVPVPEPGRGDTVFVSGITPMLSQRAASYVQQLLDAAERSECRIVFDPNIRLKLADLDAWRRTMPPLLARATTVLISEAELTLLGISEPHSLLGARTTEVVVRMGSKGAAAFTARDTVTVPAAPVAVTDLVGAGDAFTAGWIAARSVDSTLPAALHFANRLAAAAIGAPGDIGGLPTRMSVARLMEGDDVVR